MENRKRNNWLSEKFSFPIIAIQESDTEEFEFGSVTTPGSPNSPADHLFFNGKLLPHVFPLNYNQTAITSYSFSRSTSRTSSKDSLMSSRSNSTNSRSSNCSSARTSTSTEPSERKKLPNFNPQYKYNTSVQRWQLIGALIGPSPVLMHQGSRSRTRSVKEGEGKEMKKSRKMEKDGKKNGNDDHGKSWFGMKILKAFVSTCKKCHAIETST